jgi:hypothetical protein
VEANFKAIGKREMTRSPNQQHDNLSPSDRINALERRLEDMDGEFSAQAQFLLDLIGESHKTNSDQLNQLASNLDRTGIQVDRNALAIDRLSARFEKFIEQAEADRALMVQLLQVIAGQSPNGRGGETTGQ